MALKKLKGNKKLGYQCQRVIKAWVFYGLEYLKNASTVGERG